MQLGLLQKGAHISLVYCVHRPIQFLVGGEGVINMQIVSKEDWRQVNVFAFIIIGIVEKAQETSSDSDMHNTVCLCHCSTS